MADAMISDLEFSEAGYSLLYPPLLEGSSVPSMKDIEAQYRKWLYDHGHPFLGPLPGLPKKLL